MVPEEGKFVASTGRADIVGMEYSAVVSLNVELAQLRPFQPTSGERVHGSKH
jgi:hypothetical protein